MECLLGRVGKIDRIVAGMVSACGDCIADKGRLCNAALPIGYLFSVLSYLIQHALDLTADGFTDFGGDYSFNLGILFVVGLFLGLKFDGSSSLRPQCLIDCHFILNGRILGCETCFRVKHDMLL